MSSTNWIKCWKGVREGTHKHTQTERQTNGQTDREQCRLQRITSNSSNTQN